jgi:hypothetical protein
MRVPPHFSLFYFHRTTNEKEKHKPLLFFFFLNANAMQCNAVFPSQVPTRSRFPFSSFSSSSSFLDREKKRGGERGHRPRYRKNPTPHNHKEKQHPPPPQKTDGRASERTNTRGIFLCVDKTGRKTAVEMFLGSGERGCFGNFWFLVFSFFFFLFERGGFFPSAVPCLPCVRKYCTYLSTPRKKNIVVVVRNLPSPPPKKPNKKLKKPTLISPSITLPLSPVSLTPMSYLPSHFVSFRFVSFRLVSSRLV